MNFKSPLLWDVFAISTYFAISAVFWYVGLIPDLATIRDRVKPGIRKRMASLLSLGWNGSARTWHRYETVYMLLAGLATPLVFSVHTIVSMDFATSVIPGWHTTIFPPYFVAGAIFSGLAMVLTLMIIARKVMALEAYVTMNSRTGRSARWRGRTGRWCPAMCLSLNCSGHDGFAGRCRPSLSS